MSKTTKQLDTWTSQFGKEYTDRNPGSLVELEKLYTDNFGITRTKLNDEFVGSMSRDIRILEVGSNIANQLVCLQSMGFTHLYGIEPQSYAVETSKNKTKNINLITANAFDIPYKDGYFDMVFTSGVLIHINPKNIATALHEIYRCSRKWIWGFEYYADTYTEIPYRGNNDLLWKTDFCGLYLKEFPSLRCVLRKKIPYISNALMVDEMFLLEKK